MRISDWSSDVCSSDLGDPRALAYRIGRAEATDRLLLQDDTDDPATRLDILREWQRPHFPLTGGDLIAMGLRPGPVVAKTLQAIERQWIEDGVRSEEHTSELQSLMRNSYAVFCWKKNKAERN